PPNAQRWQQAFGDRTLYRITPVYKANSPKDKTTHEPVSEEGADARAQKLAAYKKGLSQGLNDIGALYVEIEKTWRAAEKDQEDHYFGSVRFPDPAEVVYKKHLQQVNQLIGRTMGPLWTAHPSASPVLFAKSWKDVTLKHYQTLFSNLFEA